MTTPVNAELEQLLCTAWSEEAAMYADALALARSLPTSPDTPVDTSSALQKLDRLLADIAAKHAHVREIQHQWEVRGGQPTPQMETTIDSLRSNLTQLMEIIQKAETAAAERQQKLRPELNQEVATHRMRTAYQHASLPDRAAS